MANGKRRRNRIPDINFNGVLETDQCIIRRGVFSYFQDHFRKAAWQRPKMSWDGLRKILDEDRVQLEKVFSLEEVWCAVLNCDGNKALGPDGFNLNFIKAHLGEIQDDFMNFIHEFHNGGSMVRELNRAFIALIPKVVKPETLKDYRPICLVDALYKVLVKVLANRLRKIMDVVIGET
ncbi:hypothetical protein Ddye_024741 [Dipteronia dyeriana]|uniref:Reverse transcriptase n=1 Tax=Dipteronia dyeriana TaxID=168575 RepID=A0AAD9WUH0_9ROSI|nr:hypothetical protein Ddye_024741 [Dipteronia dyeriana]